MRATAIRTQAIALCWLMLAASPVLAAQGGGALTGTAEDQTGAAVPAAHVILIDRGTGQVRETVADKIGRFSFENLAPGEYSIIAHAEDLRSDEKAVTIGALLLDVKVRLKVGLEEELTVTGSTDALAPANSGEVVAFDENVFRQLPSNSDNLLLLASMFLAPSAQGTGGPSVVVDGVETDDLDVPLWAVKSVEVDRNPYSAAYRQPGTSRIEITTKQGSHRRFRGHLAMFERNSLFDARNAFAVERPPLTRFVLEAGLSGPLPVDHAWFLANGSRMVNHGTAVVNARTLDGVLVENVPTNHDRTNLLAQVAFRLAGIHAFTSSYALLDNTETAQGVGGFTLPEHGVKANKRVQRIRLADQAVPSSRFSNSLQMTVKHEEQSTGGPADQPSIVVHGAFTSGPSPTFRRDRATTVELEESGIFSRGAQTFRFGARVRPKLMSAVDSSNFAGTFRFAGLGSFAARDPFVFQISRGRPEVSFDDTQASAYAQGEMRPRSDLSALIGLRYDWQSLIRSRRDLAPRAAITFAPGAQKTIVRAGFGIFYDRLSDSARRRALLFGGDRVEQAVVLNPGFPVLPDASPSASIASVTRLADGIGAPYVVNGSVSIQRALSKTMSVTASFNRTDGHRLFRSRDVNAPPPGSGTRPNPAFLTIDQVESSGTLVGNTATLTMQGRYGSRLAGTVQYRLSKTTNDASGVFALPADSYNLEAERGRAGFDRRHQLNATATLSLPRAFKIGLVAVAASGLPYDITTGFDGNHNGVANDRPAGVTRNTGAGPGMAQLDIRVSRRIHAPTPIREKRQRNLDVNIDAFNVFNKVNLANFVGVQTSAFFGRANAALAPRTIQLSFNYHF